jgi:membrane protease subunit HflK
MRRWALRLILGGLLLAWLLTGIKEIGPGERAVVRRFGRVLDVQPHAGLWIGLPWGIDQVDRVRVDERRRLTVGYRPADSADEEAPPGQLLTGDRNLINIRIIVNYKVDPDRVVAFVEQSERVEEVIARAAEAALAEWVAGRSVDEVLLRGNSALPKEMKRLLQDRLDTGKLGIRLQEADVPYLAPPDEVRPEFDRVAQTEAERQTMVQQAKQEKLQNEDKLSADLTRLKHETATYINKTLDDARAEATAFEYRLAAYRRNPLVRAAGRLAHYLRQARILSENGQLQPLDPALDSPLRK